MKKYKPYWHIHHKDYLLEFSSNIKERLKFIDENKPPEEREIRKQLIKEVKGELPPDLIKAGKAYCKAGTAYCKVGTAYVRSYTKHKKLIEKLHTKECPGCPWDGKTIFPGGAA